MEANPPSTNSCPMGKFQYKRLQDGEPVKLDWVPAASLTAGAFVEPTDNMECIRSHDGVINDCSWLLPASIPKAESTLEGGVIEDACEPTLNGDATVTSGTAQQWAVHLGVTSGSLMRRDRRIRTAPVFASNTLDMAEMDNAAGEDPGVGGGLLPPPGLQPPLGMPSHGSGLHSIGACRPCAWYWKDGGCQNGVECMRCHLCPPGETKARKKTKVALIRLGLPSQLAACKGALDAPAFLPLPSGSTLITCADAEDVSTACTESAQELTSGPSSEDEVSVGSEPFQDGKEDESFPSLRGKAQAEADTDQDAAQIEGDTEASSTAGILQRRDRRARTEPIGLRWAIPSDMTDEIDTEEKPCVEEDGKMHGPVEFPPGLQPPHGTFSVGSASHSTGACRPCAWFWKPDGCQNGQDCMHCHICPDGEIKTRKKARKASLRPSPDLA